MSDNADLRAAWNTLCDTLKTSADYVFDEELGVDDSERAEGLRHHLRMFTWTLDHLLENNDPTRPELGWVYPSKIGQDNPDAIYMRVPLDLQWSYRLTGRMDTVRYLGFAIMNLNFGRGEIQQLLSIGTPDLTDVGGGRFDVVISPNPNPGDHVGDWHQVTGVNGDGKVDMLVRQFFSDWTTEDHAELHLECLDASGPVTRLDPPSAVASFEAIGAEMQTLPRFWTDFNVAQRGRNHVNSFAHVQPDSATGLAGSDQQTYGQCWYEVVPDEALLLEVTPPDCWYWNIQVGDVWYQSLDYVNLLATLNDSQARLDPDGVLRVVISHSDPLVQNWIELGGCQQGALTYRWNNADGAPIPSLRLVPFAQLDEHLHPDTVRLSAEERAQQRQLRRRHALRRFNR